MPKPALTRTCWPQAGSIRPKWSVYAASVAGLMLTTEAMITEKPEKKKAPAMPPGGGMDPGMY